MFLKSAAIILPRYRGEKPVDETERFLEPNKPLGNISPVELKD